MSDSPHHVFTVRGRPVGFRRTRFGGELLALERGYFPVSATGYRSVAGHFGATKPEGIAHLTPEFLEALAAAEDRDRRALLARLGRKPHFGADPLASYLAVSIDAATAIDAGFFAPEADRVALWRGAHRLLSLIDSDRRFQPAPGGRWTAADCVAARAETRELLHFVQQIAVGKCLIEPLRDHLCARAYFALPPKPNGETPFALPALTWELPPGLPPADGECEPDAVSAIPDSRPVDDDPEQLNLLLDEPVS